MSKPREYDESKVLKDVLTEMTPSSILKTCLAASDLAKKAYAKFLQQERIVRKSIRFVPLSKHAMSRKKIRPIFH
jgi:hypothetical protein